MRAALAAALLLTLASGARADLGDFDTSLGEIAFDEVQVSPDGSRLAFITRGNDFEQDREVSTLWRTRPVRWRRAFPSRPPDRAGHLRFLAVVARWPLPRLPVPDGSRRGVPALRAGDGLRLGTAAGDGPGPVRERRRSVRLAAGWHRLHRHGHGPARCRVRGGPGPMAGALR